MKKVVLTAVGLLFSGAVSYDANAGTVTIGTVNDANCYPFMCNDSGTSNGPSITYQQVYAASAFPGPISVTDEEFTLAQGAGVGDTLLGGTYVFTLSTTSAPVNGLNASSLSANLGADAAQVLSVTIPAGGISFGASYTFTNTSPFDYNPANGNLLLQVAVSNQDNVFNGDGNSFNDADENGLLTSRAYAFNGFDSGSADSIGLVTTFSFGSSTPVPEPSSLLVAAGGVLLMLGMVRVREERR
jgi:hypothetical protein